LPRSGNLGFVRHFKVIGAITRPIKGIHSEPILEGFEGSKMPFLAYTGGKPLLSRCDYLANSHAKHFETLLFLPEFCKPPVQFTVYKKAPTTSRHD
jgi:hypothetical protein